METTILYKYNNGVKEVYPQHPYVNNWIFREDSEDEAHLALYVARVAEKNGMSINEVMNVFPFILRMLKSKNIWAGNENS